MQNGFRLSGRKYTFTYEVGENEIKLMEKIYQNIKQLGKIEKYSTEFSANKLVFYVKFFTKINVRSAKRFMVKYEGKIYHPTIEPLKAFPENATITDERANFFYFIRMLEDRDDADYLMVLKKQPEYALLQELGMSEFHVFSNIICKLYEADKQDQEEKLKAVMEKLKNLEYVNLISPYFIQRRVKQFTPAQLQEIFYIFKGIH